MILSLEPWRDEVLEEALKHDIIFADDINLDIKTMQLPKRANNLTFSCFTCSKVFQVLILCVEFRELSHVTHDLSQAEKAINVVTS